MDGVLVDSEPFHKQVLEFTLKDLGLSLTQDYYESLVGTANGPMWERIASDFSLSNSISELKALHRKFQNTLLYEADVPLTTGVKTLLDRLHTLKIRKCIASSSDPDLIAHFVTTHGLSNYFEHFISGVEVARSKPFPDIFLRAAQMFDEGSEQFVVIEDSTHGTKAAIAAGMYCIGYRNPQSGSQDLSAAHRIIADFDELTSDVLTDLLCYGAGKNH